MTPHPPADEITWDIGIPLLTNPTMLGGMLKVAVGATMIPAALVSLLLGVQGDWRLVPSILALFGALGLGFLVLSLLIMGVVFGNRFDTRFTVGPAGIRSESIDRRGKLASRAALIAGLLTGRANAVGAGVLAIGQEMQSLDWRGAFRAQADPGRRTITLSNRWRTLMTVYCSADNFAAVRERIESAMAAHDTARRSGNARSPLAACVWRSALAVIASLPVFALADVYDLGLLLPLLLMCFAIAIVWFVRHLAWVVLGLSALLAAQVLIAATAMRSSGFRAGVRFRRFEVLSGDDWALTALAALGVAWLCFSAIQVLRRRVVPALESDIADSGGQ